MKGLFYDRFNCNEGLIEIFPTSVPYARLPTHYASEVQIRNINLKFNVAL
jgi:hypothetical protein